MGGKSLWMAKQKIPLKDSEKLKAIEKILSYEGSTVYKRVDSLKSQIKRMQESHKDYEGRLLKANDSLRQACADRNKEIEGLKLETENWRLRYYNLLAYAKKQGFKIGPTQPGAEDPNYPGQRM